LGIWSPRRALEAYREAVRISGNNKVWFRETFFSDSKYLKKTGITDLDTSLMWIMCCFLLKEFEILISFQIVICKL
jgi:hypothetical protein